MASAHPVQLLRWKIFLPSCCRLAIRSRFSLENRHCTKNLEKYYRNLLKHLRAIITSDFCITSFFNWLVTSGYLYVRPICCKQESNGTLWDQSNFGQNNMEGPSRWPHDLQLWFCRVWRVAAHRCPDSHQRGLGQNGFRNGFKMSVKKGPELFSFSPSILLNLLFCLAICSIFELEAAISTVLQHFGVRTYHFPWYLPHFDEQNFHVGWYFVTRTI